MRSEQLLRGSQSAFCLLAVVTLQCERLLVRLSAYNVSTCFRLGFRKAETEWKHTECHAAFKSSVTGM